MASTDRALQLFLEGLTHQTAGNHPSALLAYRRLLQIDPGHADGMCNLASVLSELGRKDEAWLAVSRALEGAPSNAVALCVRGNLRLDREDTQGAREDFQTALRHDPESILARSGLATLFHKLNLPEEALKMDEEAHRIAPDRMDVLLNLGFGLMRLGHLDEAEEAFQQVLCREPENAKARWNLFYTRFLQERWEEAWPDFHARLQVPEASANLRDFHQPFWDGAPLEGKTLLVWGEQGFGDAIQFIRYIPFLKAARGRVIYLGYEALEALFRSVQGLDLFVSEGSQVPPFDFQIPLLHLPVLFQTTPQNVASEVPYLAVEDGLPESLTKRLTQGAGGPRVGLAWAGSKSHVDDHRRSLDPNLLGCLKVWENVRFFSLQVGTDRLPPLPGLVDLAPALRNYADTARVIQEMDLVISVDTSVAHLAGALGIPVLLLLPFFPDWRWGWDGETTPWYPTMQILRQSAPGDWDGVMRRLAALG